jgi:uncharacterized protein YneF (UPF0154 family)
MLLATDITIGEAFALSGVAMAIIMAVLALIMLLIYGTTFVLKQLDNLLAKRKKSPTVLTEEPVKEEIVFAKGSAGEVSLFDVPDRDAAMVMAIVADKAGLPLNELKFISIKEVTNSDELAKGGK